jgi:DMSO/TMAO reductase YedYZ heme-binding membrane subunit
MRSQVWWDVARAGGIVAWGLAALSVISGLQLATRLVRRPAAAWMLDVHRFLGGLAVAFLGVHLLGLAVDEYIGFGVGAFLVPFASPYKPAAVALGVLALYLLLAVEISSLLMKRLARRHWRAIHFSSYAVYVTATVHGLTAGTDRNDATFQWACLASATIVLMMTLVRIWSPRSASRSGTGGRRGAVAGR